MLKGTGKLSGEALFDSRLFNQSAGLDSGFGAEDEYNQYSKPLFDRGVVESIYKPKSNDDGMLEDADAEIQKLKEQSTRRFQPDKGFSGAESAGAAKRTGPVQFTKAKDTSNDSSDEDGNYSNNNNNNNNNNSNSSNNNSNKRKGDFEVDEFGIGDLVGDKSSSSSSSSSNKSRRRKDDRDHSSDEELDRKS